MKTETKAQKYSYFYNEEGDYTITRNLKEDDETPIAMAIDEDVAAFIVKACNNHDAMLEALKKVVTDPSILVNGAAPYHLRDKYPQNGRLPEWADKYAEIIDVIKAAEQK